jgi:carbon-monoxide dehydrogenase medium subunit
MKPAAFEFARAASLREAAAMLAQAGGTAKVVAGCQSLGPMLNLRLAQPRLLLDITGVPELTRAEETAEQVIIGACVTTADIEDARAPVRALPMLRAVAAGIAYRAVRNRGTIGGSLCHADPAADWTSALTALGAECIVSDGRGSRRVPVERFMTGAFEVALAADELLEAISIPRVSPRGRWGYYKVCRKTGEFALAIGAVLLDPEREAFRAVMGATHGKPIVVEDARAVFGGRAGDDDSFDEAAAARLLDQHGLRDSIARRLHLTALHRAGLEALRA